jgi:hypothetical protein
VLCNPVVWENDAVGFAATGSPPNLPFFSTGYDYFGRLDECMPNSPGPYRSNFAVKLTPVGTSRLATRSHNGVLWGDDVVFYSGNDPGGSGGYVAIYAHGKSDVIGHASPTAPNFAPNFLGEHCAWSDGSVEWRAAAYVGIDDTNRDASASYLYTFGGVGVYDWWF